MILNYIERSQWAWEGVDNLSIREERCIGVTLGVKRYEGRQYLLRKVDKVCMGVARCVGASVRVEKCR